MDYSELQQSDDPWCCPLCFKQALPFHNCSSISNNSSSLSLSTPPPHPPQCHRQHQNESLKNLPILYTNCRSLLPKLDSLRAEALSSRPHVIALTETWIDSSISNHEIFIPGYSSIRRDRSRHGGGILLYITESITINSTNTNETSELLFVDLRLKHCSIMIGLFYRPPSSQPSSLSDLESALESTPPASMKNFVLVGDFNINLLQPDSPSAIELTNITSSFHLSQVVNSPTRETDHSATLIDHVYTSDTRLINSRSILPPLDSSDHNSILTTLNLSPPSITPLRQQVWLYSRANFDAVNSDLEYAISSMDSQVDVNSAWNQFRNTFLSVLSNHIPSKILTTRKSLP